MENVSIDQARAAKSKAADAYRGLGTMVGVGITRLGCGYAVKVSLKEAAPPDVSLPEVIDGVPVTVEVVGPVRRF